MTSIHVLISMVGFALESALFANASPNIVIFIADDLGYGDVGCFGNTSLKTPNIDRLATEGAKMTHHLAAASMCSPSRTALLTGRYPVRSGMVPSGHIRINTFLACRGGLPHGEITIAELAKSAGYKTALIGKWHLGMSRTIGDNVYHPKNQGFDSFYGLPLTNLRDFGDDGDSIFRAYMPAWLWRCFGITMVGCLTSLGLYKRAYVGALCCLVLVVLTVVPVGTFLFVVTNMKILNSMIYKDFDIVEQPIRLRGMTQRFAKESVEFLEQQKIERNPFLLVVSWTHVHTAIQVTKEFRGRTRHGLYGDAVEELDSGVGEITDALNRLGLRDDTIVYFTSDNGGYLEEKGLHGEMNGGYNGIFKGGKGQGAVEGGIRMPGVIRWPGKIPPGTVVNEPTWMMDMYPTLARAMRAELPSDRPLDGKDILPLLRQQDTVSPHTFMVHYCGIDVHAIRYRPRTGIKVWKLVLRSPNYVSGTNKCVPICTCPDAIIHSVPFLYELTSDPSEANPLNYSGNTDLEKVVAIIQQGHGRHIRSVEPVEIQFSTRNLIWRPHLQVCCNFPSCHCKDPKYADYN
ncbi:steryl-sulfatase-like [Mizuhopecten yessoensis]|uniref:Steryl-sulfatase n=1 Tax=Mizuhopecten yessoensis TaxID=6573 RepID=A0A210PV65_MIZYE|nr:steryl-sulfatase-like [Mizuhopecten yessoensis]OWF40355.1 Steryl-sulfatase [Mizuhopecten yessoensis]